MTIGINLGHQLLADALGGTCGPQNPPEIGIMEIEPDTVDNWTQIPAYHTALINSGGESALSEMKQQSAANMPGFNRAAEQLYKNFRAAVGV